MIVTFCLQEDSGPVSAIERARLTVASVRKAMPSARIVQLTNETFQGLAEVDDVYRHPRGKLDFIEWAFSGLIEVCRRHLNVLQIATDVLVLRDVEYQFEGDFDIAACRYPARTRTDGAFCGDVNFIRPLGVGFLRRALAIYRGLPERDGWEGGQTAFLRAHDERQGKRFRELDFERYCRTPETPSEEVGDAALVHFRGPRKEWMPAYARRLGIS